MELLKMQNKFSTKKFLRLMDQQNAELFWNQLTHNPMMLQEFDCLRKIWEEARHVQKYGAIDVHSDWKLISARIDAGQALRNNRVPFGVYFLRIAALLVLTCGLSVGFYKLIIAHNDADMGFTQYTAEKGIKNVILPDGSTVSLNAGSNLTLRNGYGVTSREVVLIGEAFFNVIHGAKLPFKVYSGASVIEVTGTKFSVFENKGKVQVSVVCGTVNLSSFGNQPKKISITANQSGYLLSNNELKIEDGIPANTLSWKTGNLIFEQTPIDSALIDIAHYFRKDLTIDSKINDRVTAEFHDQPLHEILDELSLVAGLRFDTTATALIVRK
jgi:transmembrane sensor